MAPITREFLERRKAAIQADLLLKFEAEDYHGVADAAMDLREIQAQLEVLASPYEAKALASDVPLAPFMCHLGGQG